MDSFVALTVTIEYGQSHHQPAQAKRARGAADRFHEAAVISAIATKFT
jgi:hypothetical protein